MDAIDDGQKPWSKDMGFSTPNTVDFSTRNPGSNSAVEGTVVYVVYSVNLPRVSTTIQTGGCFEWDFCWAWADKTPP